MIGDGQPTMYRVVLNHRGQHSIWPADATPPLGWTASGPPAIRADCLARIAAEWHDIRPAAGKVGRQPPAVTPEPTEAEVAEHEG
jgi:MbtH protein